MFFVVKDEGSTHAFGACIDRVEHLLMQFALARNLSWRMSVSRIGRFTASIAVRPVGYRRVGASVPSMPRVCRHRRRCRVGCGARRADITGAFRSSPRRSGPGNRSRCAGRPAAWHVTVGRRGDGGYLGRRDGLTCALAGENRGA